jgi:hypothetical protein
MQTKRRTIMGVLIAAASLLISLLVFIGVYAMMHLAALRKQPAYATPEEGMRQLIPHWYAGVKKIEIEGQGKEFSDDLIYIVSRVWTDQRSDATRPNTPQYHNPGEFFLRVQNGWVHVPESKLPHLIALGKRLYKLTEH